MNKPQHVQKLYSQFIGSCFLLLLVFLSYVVKFHVPWLHGFDQFFTHLIRSGSPKMDPFFLWITKFGNPSTVTILFLVITGLFLYRKKYTEAIWLSLGIIGIVTIANSIIKFFIMRERPSLTHLVHTHSYSFPSGHANGSMILYGSLFLLIPLLINEFWIKRGLQLLCLLLILGIGTSRVYLGVHYPSDILAGYAEGLAWLGFSYPIFKEQRFIWRFKQKQR